ncbi:MAG TPA: ribonuclease HII [Bacteroidales bacterium]|nr:ribonuclease HII [Bacteroidales bacterium]
MSQLKACYKDAITEAGLDEAGRGCLAGPVVAAAVILPADADHPLLNDSKKLSHKHRLLLRAWVMENALAWAIGMASVEEIDRINILNASFLAMHRAVDQLNTKPSLLLVDGNRFNKYPQIAHQCIIGGDGKYRSIAAASVLAKTERDHLMEQLHHDFPEYDWVQNKGYPTKKHKSSIAHIGICPHHRRSFNMGIQLDIDFV